MDRLRQAVALSVALLLAAGALYLGLSWHQERAPPSDIAPASLSPGAFYAASFPDLQGNPHSLGQWQGKVIVLNFWATWCAPCREEMPIFVRLQDRLRERGVVFLGLALDEREKVVAFISKFPVNYPLLIGNDTATEFSRRLGNTSASLPFTVILDRQGKLVVRQLGPFSEPELDLILKALV